MNKDFFIVELRVLARRKISDVFFRVCVANGVGLSLRLFVSAPVTLRIVNLCLTCIVQSLFRGGTQMFAEVRYVQKRLFITKNCLIFVTGLGWNRLQQFSFSLFILKNVESTTWTIFSETTLLCMTKSEATFLLM